MKQGKSIVIFIVIENSLAKIAKHWVKNVQIRSFFWSVFYRIQSERGGNAEQKNFVFGHFSRSERFL